MEIYLKKCKDTLLHTTTYTQSIDIGQRIWRPLHSRCLKELYLQETHPKVSQIKEEEKKILQSKEEQKLRAQQISNGGTH